jgi:glycosyltransferase involved in cell wall biosynthesis
MNKIAIFCHGVPNLNSNQPNADTLMHAIKLAKEGYNVKIVCIYNEEYQSDITQEKYKEIFEKKNLSIHIIFPKLKSFLIKVFNRINLKLYPNLIDKDLIYQRDDFLKNFKPDIIINFFERAIELNKSVKIKKINYLSIPLDKVEILRLKLLGKRKFNISTINSIIFLIVYKLKIKYLLNDAKINFISCPQSYDIYKNKNIKNLEFFFPLNRIKPKNQFKKKELLMIGNLKSTFVVDALTQFNEKIVHELEHIRKDYPFEIIIVGKFLEEKLKYKNLLNKDWIKFKGWVDNVDDYFQNSIALFVPSKNKLSVRTKILDAFSCGLPVITFDQNNFDKSIFKHNENIICAKNIDEIIVGLRSILTDDNFREYISKNSYKTYYKKINIDNTINKNINLIKKLV